MVSITELRSTAQGLGIDFSFSDDAKILQQKINLKVEQKFNKPISPPEYVPQDGRLRDKPPTRRSNEEMIQEMLAEFVKRGLHLSFDKDTWYMQFGKREDSGTIRCQPRDIINCAKRIMA